uniref:Eukaryotic aspartyl protease n=1 Tax=Podospora anserina (strain S / ATCC MYA-4624 / DSM 980 / FGSC 10383) TaxID=515849 RepID=A0A090CR40_PODAN|nr:Putative Eukaryotic aspartyl protease [Podospora anserina S mat+]
MKSSLLAFLAVGVAHSAGRLLHATRHGLVPDTVTSNVIPMRKHIVPSSEHRSSVVKPVYRRTADVNHPANLTNVHDVYYIVDIVVGNQTLAVSVDTGSSDTWFVSDYFECVRFWWQGPEYKPNCGLADGFTGNLSGGVLDNPPFVRSYMDTTFVSGYYGFEDVTVGSITAKNQRVGVVNYTFWAGDGLTSGLLGLGYPFMTSLDGAEQNQAPYDPVFTTMWKNKLIDPLFSIALSRESGNQGEPDGEVRTPEGSYLALGGLPPVEVDEESWARTKIHGVDAIPEWMFEQSDLGLYIIKPDSWVYGRETEDVTPAEADQGAVTTHGLTTNTTQFPVLIDVGATLSLLPKGLVQKLYAAFDPPAKYLSTNGLFFALCNATIPKFGVNIGENTFYFAPEDLLRQTARDPSGEYCRIGVTDVNGGPYVLGVSFLSSVVAVFDIENTEMRFASRTKY